MIAQIVGLALGLVAATATLAHSDEEATHKAAAAKLMEQGNREFSRREFGKALAAFRAAYAKFPSPKIHLNIGFAHQSMGHLGFAAEEFDRFLQEGVYAAPTDALGEARKRLAEIAPQVGQARFTGLGEGDRLTVDGQAVTVARAVLRLYLDPGAHTASVERDGEHSVTHTFRVAAGAVAVIDVASPSLTAPNPSLVAPLVRDRDGEVVKPRAVSNGRVITIAGAAATGLLALGVIGTGIGAILEHQAFVDPARAAAARDSARTTGVALAWTSDGLLIGAIVIAAATTAYLLWLRFHPAAD